MTFDMKEVGNVTRWLNGVGYRDKCLRDVNLIHRLARVREQTRVSFIGLIGVSALLMLGGCKNKFSSPAPEGTSAHMENSIQDCNTENTQELLRRSDGKVEDVRIIRIGKTLLYIPVSWFRYAGWIDSRPQRARSIQKDLAKYLKPVPLEIECAGIIHDLYRNPPMLSRGLEFWLSGKRNSRDHPKYINEHSMVYKISFSFRPAYEGNAAKSRDLFTILKSHQDNDGWSRYNDIFFDMHEFHATDLNMTPSVSAPETFENNVGQSKWNDDVMVAYWWKSSSGPEELRSKWREIRISVDNLIEWLATPPAKRSDVVFSVGGD